MGEIIFGVGFENGKAFKMLFCQGFGKIEFLAKFRQRAEFLDCHDLLWQVV